MQEVDIKVYVEKIYSYQTLIYKNGARTFPKPRYKKYQEEMKVYFEDIKGFESGIPLELIIQFNIKGGVDLPVYAVKMLDTNNTSKLFNTLEEAEKYMDEDIHYIEKRKMEVKYGVVGDNDNITKPILDTLEKFEVFENDRFVMHSTQKKTFNNKENSMEIKVRPLKTLIDKDEIVYFE